KHFRRGLLIALVAVVTFFYPLLTPTPHRIDETHVSLIDKGMSRAQVEAIFGVPPGQYDWPEGESAALRYYPVTSLIIPARPWKIETWTSRHGSFGIQFDEHDHVTWTH